METLVEFLKDVLSGISTGLYAIGILILCTTPFAIIGMILPHPYWKGFVVTIISLTMVYQLGNCLRKG